MQLSSLVMMRSKQLDCCPSLNRVSTLTCWSFADSRSSMPLRLDVRKKLSSRSDRVKAIDLHSSEPWICASLYNGNVHVWNIETQQLIKTFEVCAAPVRAVRFVPRKNWLVTGSDDMMLRVYNYNTLERVHQFEAHSDYIRSIAVHPTQPFILTSSDDMFIRLWDWEKNWACAQVFEGHTHYVMQLVINPKDNNTFATGSLDKTVKVWSLGSPQANFTLEGHDRGVNCVDYHPSADKPYLASGSDDRTVRVWDYQTKLCVQILEGHSQNVSSLAFHPDLPIILTGSEDGTVRMWHSNTYRLESTLNYGLERVWAVTCHKGSQQVGIGYDEGTIVISLGREDPAMSMDSSGKLVCARHAELVQANIRSVFASLTTEEGPNTTLEDGARLPIVYKEMGACEIYPQTLSHSANGRFVVVCGDGEYIIYTAMALRNRMFGQALEFVWSQADANMYAVLETNAIFKIFKNFKVHKSIKLDFGADQIFGGHLLGVRSVAGFTFYDWQTGQLVRRIDVAPKAVYWADGGQLVAICTKDCFYILRYRPEAVAQAEAAENDPDGFEAAFEVLHEEVKESVKTGCWFGDAFLFTNTANRLLYFVGGELVTVAHLDRPMYLLGYLASENRVFLSDRDLNVVGFTLLLSVLEYETAVLRGDFAVADSILPSIPPSHRTKIAHFLERQGFRQQAMRVTTDPDHKFDLALQLNDLTTAHDLIKDDEDVDSNESKWRQLADLAVKECDFKLAQECFSKTRDYASFLLIATSAGDAEQLEELSRVTAKEEMDNLAFLSLFLLNNLEGCLQLLVKAQRYPEAAIFARTYLPSKVPEMVELWRKWLSEDPKLNKAAEALADPQQYPNLFPGWEASLNTEKWLQADRERHRHLPASAYPSQPALWDRRPAEEMQKSPFASAPAVHVEHKPAFQPPTPAPVQPDDVQVKSQSGLEPLHQPVIAPSPAKTHLEQPTRDPIADLLSLSALNSETAVTSTTEAPTNVFEAFPSATLPADNESAFDPFEMTTGPPTTLTAEPSLPPASLKPQAPQTFDTDLFDFKAAPATQAATESPLSHYEQHPQQGKQSPGVQHLQKTVAEEEEEDFGLELERQLASLNVAPSTGATHTDAPPKSAAADLEWGDEDDFEDPEEA
ncbi:Coatomer subunit beta' [Sparganum proliferum]